MQGMMIQVLRAARLLLKGQAVMLKLMAEIAYAVNANHGSAKLGQAADKAVTQSQVAETVSDDLY